MVDPAVDLKLTTEALAASERGDHHAALAITDSLLSLVISREKRIRTHLMRAGLFDALRDLESAGREVELALEADHHEPTGVFQSASDRSAFSYLDDYWHDRLKSYGREGDAIGGIQYGEERLQLLDHISGSYMPLTQLWIARKLGLFGHNSRALERTASGLAAEVPRVEHWNYNKMVDHAVASARKALQMHENYGALSSSQAYETGTAAFERGDAALAIRAFEDALALRPHPDVAVHCHVRLAALYQKEGQPRKAATHGESALKIDAGCTPRLFDDADDFRDVFLASLERSWVQVSINLKGQKGLSTARAYLMERLRLGSNLPEHSFPMVRYSIGTQSLELRDFDTARDYLASVLASDFPHGSDRRLHQLYDEMRSEAGRIVLQLAEKRRREKSDDEDEPQDTKKSGTQCWIATAACGAESVEVAVLRVFRDRHLNQGLGACFRKGYYRTAPYVARWMEAVPLLADTMRNLVVTPIFRYAVHRLVRKGNKR